MAHFSREVIPLQQESQRRLSCEPIRTAVANTTCRMIEVDGRRANARCNLASALAPSANASDPRYIDIMAR
jgi:hypothetical protein